MDGFNNLEIKNFRGIEHLTIDDFTEIWMQSIWIR